MVLMSFGQLTVRIGRFTQPMAPSLRFAGAIIGHYTPDEQAALRECASVGRDVERQVISDLNKKSLEKIKAAGLEVTVLPSEEQARIREKSLVVYEKHRAEIGAEVVDGILAKLAEIRK